MRRSMFFLSSSLSFGGFLPFGFSCRSSPSASRSILRTDSTSSLICSISRRLTSSVNSTSRTSCDNSTCARIDGPARPAILALLAGRRALRRVVELFLELLHDRALLADRVDLLQHLLRALVHPLVGNLVVLEDDELADRARAGFQLVAHRDDHLRDRRRAGDRLDDRQLAALDAPRNLDLALAGEQRHRAHLAQVHADGIVRLVQRAGREIELHLLAALGGPVELLFLEIRLLGVDDLDPRAAERIEQVVELVRRGDLGRQQFVDLVVQQIALFFPDGNQLPDFVVFFFNRQAFLLPCSNPK